METNRELLREIQDALSHLHQHIVDFTNQLHRMETNIMTELTDLRAAFGEYKASVDTYIADATARDTAFEEYKAKVDQMLIDAVAADDAGEAVDVAAFAAEMRSFVIPPKVPPPQPSTA